MNDRAVGHDCVVSLHQVQFTLVVLSGIRQAVDRAALRAGADGHTGDGLTAAHAVHCASPPNVVFWLLQKHTSTFTENTWGVGWIIIGQY